ncbi:hypothetical protein [Allocoleopsis sp.]|uniref:hypothetical protein n=1 Tax=Allocoleopsis sp. TaxID=3088169 RepID=UPI002FD5D2CE
MNTIFMKLVLVWIGEEMPSLAEVCRFYLRRIAQEQCERCCEKSGREWAVTKVRILDLF